MNTSESKDAFLKKYNITEQDLTESDTTFELLFAIANDHEVNKPHLLQVAELIAKIVQSCDAVHSVRWRIKDTGHLLHKIIRKKKEKIDKYIEINAGNYWQIITDLVGIRALHLFKNDAFQIHKKITSTWSTSEIPTAYIRSGDPELLSNQFKENGIEVKEHPAGYRSVHYVVNTQPTIRLVHSEIQVRTIFEEGWSEIDHRVRYPNFSEDPFIAQFLTIFNRLAGSADEMGDFAQLLTEHLKAHKNTFETAINEKNTVILQMQDQLKKLSQLKTENANAKAIIEDLELDLNKLRTDNAALKRVSNVLEFINGPGLGLGLDIKKKK